MSKGRVFEEDGWFVATWIDHGTEKRIARFSDLSKADAACTRWGKETAESPMLTPLQYSYNSGPQAHKSRKDRNPRGQVAGNAFRRDVVKKSAPQIIEPLLKVEEQESASSSASSAAE